MATGTLVLLILIPAFIIALVFLNIHNRRFLASLPKSERKKLEEQVDAEMRVW